MGGVFKIPWDHKFTVNVYLKKFPDLSIQLVVGVGIPSTHSVSHAIFDFFILLLVLNLLTYQNHGPETDYSGDNWPLGRKPQ